MDSELPGENGQRGQDQTLRESPACDPKVVLGLLACLKPLPRDPCCWFRERCHHSMPLESGGPGSSALQVSVSSSVTGRHHRPQPSLSVGEPWVRAGASLAWSSVVTLSPALSGHPLVASSAMGFLSEGLQRGVRGVGSAARWPRAPAWLLHAHCAASGKALPPCAQSGTQAHEVLWAELCHP